MKLNKREKILIGILVFVIIILAFTNFIYAPGMNKISELNDELVNSRITLNKLKNKQNEAAKYIKEIKNIDNEIRELDKRMSNNIDVPGIIVEFYRLLVNNGLTGDKLTIGEITRGDKYDYYTISFNAKGKKENIDTFLDELENLNIEISISGFNLTAFVQGNFEMKISISVYLYKSGKKHDYSNDYNFMEEYNRSITNWYDMFLGG